MAVLSAAAVGAYGAKESSRKQERAAKKQAEAYRTGAAGAAELYAPYRELGEAALPYLEYFITGQPVTTSTTDIAKIEQWENELAGLRQAERQYTPPAGTRAPMLSKFSNLQPYRFYPGKLFISR